MTQAKNKKCQNCQNSFVIDAADFEFYEKIGVPAPTFCWECRMVRRMASRNNRKLYKRQSDFTGKEIVSIFNNKSSYKVYEQGIWWSDKWDPMDFGQDYDFNAPFFKQFSKLAHSIPWPSLRIINSVDCDYCNGIVNSKGCYMSTGLGAEHSYYADGAIYSKDVFDSSMVVKCEKVYECVDCSNSYNLLFSRNSDDCMNSSFLYNCRNCQNCFCCVNLRNKKYHIFNKPYSKLDYAKKVKQYDFGGHGSLNVVLQEFAKHNLTFPKAWARITKSNNVTGDNISNSANCHDCYYAKEGVENSRYIVASGVALKDSYDTNASGQKSQRLYECDFVAESSNILFSGSLGQCMNVEYSMECYASSYLFGCIGLRHKQYCVFNKQYTKDEYEKLIPKIKRHMIDMPYTDIKGRVYKYGEFFPIEISRFCYNDTTAFNSYPLTKEQSVSSGYSWHDIEKSKHKPSIMALELPDHIGDVNDSILDETIECQNVDFGTCNGYHVFKIIPAELAFYKKMQIPLPRHCPHCRYHIRVTKENPRKLYRRQCQCAGVRDDSGKYKNVQAHSHKGQHCQNEFETTYAPDRPEIVYCEKCYQKEVE